MAQCVYADLVVLLFFVNISANNNMPPIIKALSAGNCIAATITATMTNTMIHFDIRLVNSSLSLLLSLLLLLLARASCLKKNI